MKFNSVLRKLLVENSRFKALYDKMVLPSEKALEKNPKAKGLINFDILKQIIFADPKTKAPDNFDVEGASIADMEQVKIGEYTQWLLKYFVAPVLPEDIKSMDPKSEEFKKYIKEYKKLYLEDLFKLTERLEYYDRVKKYKEFPADKKDINKLTPNELYDIFINFKEPERKVKEKEKKEVRKTREGFKHAGANVIYEDDQWIILEIPKDSGTIGKDAAIYYGGFKDVKNGESDWCTSAPGLTYYETYIRDGPLYVVFPQNDGGKVGKRTGLPEERYQFHFPSGQFMDRNDRQINLVEFLNGKGLELKDFFKSEFAKGLTTKGGKKVEITYPGGSAGNYVALYGFVELFDSLPKDIEHLIINNTSNQSIALDVPDTIGQFKDLSGLVLQNMVKSLPESIGNLQNLNILSLPGNKELKELPKSVNNLESLSFINLKGTNPNLIIPEEFKERMLDQGDQFYYIN